MKKTILSVCCNASLNELFRTVLSSRYHLITTTDVFAATAALIRHKHVFMLLLDADNHQKEIIDFMHHIHTSAVFNRPIVVLASEQTSLLNDEVIRNKAYDYFIKPFDPIELMSTIDELHAQSVKSTLNQLNQ